MAFNPEHNKQAVEILFSQKVNDVYHPPLIFNSSIACKVNSHKHFGLSLDPKLTFVYYINDKIKATKKAIGVLKYLSRYLPLKTLDMMYKMFIRPHFDYCYVFIIFPILLIHLIQPSPFLNLLMARIEKVQYEAEVLAITGAWQGKPH